MRAEHCMYQTPVLWSNRTKSTTQKMLLNIYFSVSCIKCARFTPTCYINQLDTIKFLFLSYFQFREQLPASFCAHSAMVNTSHVLLFESTCAFTREKSRSSVTCVGNRSSARTGWSCIRWNTCHQKPLLGTLKCYSDILSFVFINTCLWKQMFDTLKCYCDIS